MGEESHSGKSKRGPHTCAAKPEDLNRIIVDITVQPHIDAKLARHARNVLLGRLMKHQRKIKKGIV